MTLDDGSSWKLPVCLGELKRVSFDLILKDEWMNEYIWPEMYWAS
jgi:hypothetical protein